MNKLVALREKLQEKRDRLAKVFELAGSDLDFSQKEVLEHLGVSDTAAAVAKVGEWNEEINDIHSEAKQLADLEKMRDGVTSSVGAIEHPAGGPPGDDGPASRLSLGEMITQHDSYASKDPRPFRIENFGIREFKATLFTTGAGYDPEDFRIGRVIPAATRPLQVLDIVPVGSTDNSTVLYMAETTRTHGAAETAEGAAFKESTFVFTEQSSEVRKITDSLPVTDEQLDDAPMVESLLNQRLMFGVRQRLDGQIVGGNGTAPNLRGILNVSGIQTQAKGGDPVPDTVHKAMTKVSLVGRAMPDYVVMHQNDWQGIRLLRTADGIYIWGDPSLNVPAMIWGLPVVQADSLTEGTGIVGDFGNFCMLFDRRGIDVQVGYTGSQFAEGKKTIRVDMRAAFVVFRAAAFATFTGV